MKAKVLDGGISDHLRSGQQCENSIVVCNLQITNKLETRGNQEGDSRQKREILGKSIWLLIFFSLYGFKEHMY
jgi:hypothetical protein